MFVVDKVVEEDRRLLHANEVEPITLPDGTTQTLGPATRDAFAIFEDLCLLGNGERPQFLQLEYLHKTFALELIESVLTNYHDLFRKVRDISLVLCTCQSHPTCSIPNSCSSCGTTYPHFSSKRYRNAPVFRSRSVALASSSSFSNNFLRNSRRNLRYSSCSSLR
jgi:hypothetical protein